jgi:hypothetical protein
MTIRKWIPIVVAVTVMLTGEALQWPMGMGVAYAENAAERGDGPANDSMIVDLRDKTNPTPQIIGSGQPEQSAPIASAVPALPPTPAPANYLRFGNMSPEEIARKKDADAQKSNWLLGVIFKLETMRDEAMSDIRKYEGDIQRCDNTIVKSDNIVKIAQQKGNTEAENIAREASIKAQEAKNKNIELKKSAELNKKRAEIAIAYVKNVFSDALSHPQKIKSVMINYSGRVSIQKQNGEHFTFENNQIGLLEKGDEISTYENSSADLQFLDGRGSLKVGEYSRVKMEEDDADAQVMNMIQGKVNISVEKLENYQKMMEEKIKAYKEDLKTVKDETKQKIVDEYESSTKRAKAYIVKKCEVRTPEVALADRETQFLVYEDEKKGTELIVLEGSVEMKGIKGDKTIMVNEGYKCTATKGGILSDPEKIDSSNLERWWEK